MTNFEKAVQVSVTGVDPAEVGRLSIKRWAYILYTEYSSVLGVSKSDSVSRL